MNKVFSQKVVLISAFKHAKQPCFLMTDTYRRNQTHNPSTYCARVMNLICLGNNTLRWNHVARLYYNNADQNRITLFTNSHTIVLDLSQNTRFTQLFYESTIAETMLLCWNSSICVSQKLNLDIKYMSVVNPCQGFLDSLTSIAVKHIDCTTDECLHTPPVEKEKRRVMKRE